MNTSSVNLRRFPDWLPYFLLGLVSLAIYAQSIGYPLIWDSASMVLKNPATMTFDPITAFSTPTTIGPNEQSGGTGQRLNYYRPVLQIILSGWYQIAGGNAAWWHGLAVVANIIAVFIVAHLMQAMGQTRWVAFAIALVFAVNPGRVPGIVSVYGLSDQIFGIFILLALLCWVRERHGWTMVLLALALGCRETAILFPVVALFWELLFKTERRPWGWLAGQIALVVGYLIARQAVVGSVELTSMPFLGWFNSVTMILFNHLCSLLWPGWGVREYPLEDYSDLSFRVLLSYAVLIGGLGALAWSLRRNRWVAFWLLWFGVWLSIHFNVGRFGTFLMAEKNNYILALSFAVIFVGILERVRRHALALGAVVIIAHGTLSAWRVTHWRDPFTFFNSAIQSTPEFPTLHYNLGLEYVKTRNFPAAETAFSRTVELEPGHKMAWNNLGNVRYEQRNMPGAIQAWERALQQGNILAARNLSVAYSQAGNKDLATRYYSLYQNLKAGKTGARPTRSDDAN